MFIPLYYNYSEKKHERLQIVFILININSRGSNEKSVRIKAV